MEQGTKGLSRTSVLWGGSGLRGSSMQVLGPLLEPAEHGDHGATDPVHEAQKCLSRE